MNLKSYKKGCILYLLSCVIAILIGVIQQKFNVIFLAVASMPLIFVCPVVFKIFKMEKDYRFYNLFLFFAFLAAVLGSSLRFYDIFADYDTIVHFISGFYGIMIGWQIINKMLKEKSIGVKIFLSNMINISIAALWEQYEFMLLVLFDYDAIKNRASGVVDSMTDINVCIVGGLLMSLAIYYLSKRRNNEKKS